MWAPCCAQHHADFGEKIHQYAFHEAVQVESEAKDAVDSGHEHLEELVLGYGVLVMHWVGCLKEYEDRFDACGGGLLEVGSVSNVEVNVIVNVDVVQHRCWVASFV